QDLLRHRVPDGDLATIVEKAVDLLIEEVKKERFATGRKSRQQPIKETDKGLRATFPIRSSASFTNATGGAARSSTRTGAGAQKPALWNSIMSRDSRGCTRTNLIASGFSAVRTTSTPQNKCMDEYS